MTIQGLDRNGLNLELKVYRLPFFKFFPKCAPALQLQLTIQCHSFKNSVDSFILIIKVHVQGVITNSADQK